MDKKNANVDEFLENAEKWRAEMAKLRAIALDCGLTEELKWNKPCYTFQDSNVVIIQEFKEFCALLFCKGALLKDAKGILQKPGENTQAARRIPFTKEAEIVKLEASLKAYIREAIAAEKAGLEVTYKKPSELKLPQELRDKMAKDAALKRAFEALTPGRQRGYVIFIAAAKQAETRAARVEKYRERILEGIGINDRY